MKIFLRLLILTVFISTVAAQAPAPAGSQPAASASTDAPNTGATSWEDFLIDDFEDAGLWVGDMPRDQGIVRVMRRSGSPGQPKEDNPDTHKYVLGAKVNFFKSGSAWFAMSPPREIPVKGVTKKLSIWVAGRNFKHELKALIRDFFGTEHVVNFGKLNFPGWNKMEAQIGMNVAQDNYKLYSKNRPRGIRLKSIMVDCAMDETFGQYYIYLDDLYALTDTYLDREEGQDPEKRLGI